MTQRTFSKVAGVIFLLIAVLHALRLVYGWGAVIGGWAVPMWLSWVALVVAGYLTYHGLRFGKRSL